MVENIRLSLRGIWTHKMRSFLTMLGIIIGIASIIAIVSIVEGTNKKLEKSLVGSGNNVTAVQLCQDGYPYDFSSGLPDKVPTVTKDSLRKIKKESGVLAASVYQTRQDYQALFYKNKGPSTVNITGIDSQYFKTMRYKLVKGRTIQKSEYKNGTKVAIIDTAIEKAVFGEQDPLGQIIEIKTEPYVVVGVVNDSKNTDKEYDSVDEYYMYGSETQGGNVYVPTKTWPIIYEFDEPQSVAIRVSDTKQMAAAGKECADILNASVTSETLKYTAANAQQSAEELKTLTNAIKLMLVSIASLSLLVGGIGVMNIMLVSVTERTSEIGLKKALGAKKRVILGQFLTESAVLTSVGGILGVILGIILAKIISMIASLEFAVSVPSIVISVLFSMGIGILFGMMPAAKAAKLNPIDALRRE